MKHQKKILLMIAGILITSSLLFAQKEDTEAVKQVLNRYKTGIEKLDTIGLSSLFVRDSKVYEQAKDEGTVEQYLQHHLGPELKAFKSFSFSDYKVDVILAGDYSFTTETYMYTIVLAKDDSIIKSQGVATSILKKTRDGWKIALTHSSFRKTK